MEKDSKKVMDKLLSFFSKNERTHIYTRPLFGHIGVFYDEAIFARIHNNEVHLRGHSQYLQKLEEMGLKLVKFRTSINSVACEYYQISESLWQNEAQLTDLLHKIISCSSHDKKQFKITKNSRIKDLANMTLSLERMLFKIGVVSVDSFKKQGAIKSYTKLKQNNNDLSINILYILHCALLRNHLSILTDNEKKQLKEEYEQSIKI